MLQGIYTNKMGRYFTKKITTKPVVKQKKNAL